MTETINLPFEVSARTARLIGRENIASPKGAIIELVKNAYDADSEICIVYFDIKIPSKKRQFTITEYESLLALGIENETFVEACDYDPKNQYYTIKPNLTDAVRSRFTKEISKYNSIFIIDSGEGMNQDIIRNHWMNIGTDNKLIDQFSKNGRIKSGAKGIGRFALDKLGRICEMTTVFNPKVHKNDTDIHGNKTNFSGYKWRVNWDDFEGDGKKINQVTAELTGIATDSIRQEVMSVLPEFVLKQFDATNHFESGTILKISQLREDWVDENIDEVYSDLEVLAPPRESSEFGLFFFYSQKENKYGKVESSICDDYDYRLVAKADKTQRVQIRLYRREFDVELIPPVFFEKQKEKGSPFKKEEFTNGYIEKMMDFRQLLPGFEERSEGDSLSLIGEFEFTFYYLKRTFNQRDAKRFFYKSFQPNLRKQWLNKFGGIKLYRDNFRVRPYGESKNSAFDWLNLGNRKAASPSGVAKGDAGYRVEPENIAGSVKISRLGNESFQDKSSREGLQENNVFQIFKNLLIAIINVFENDRSTLAREFELFNDEITPNAKLEKLMSEIQQEFEQYDESYQKLMVPEFAIEDFPELSKFKFLAYGMNQLLKKKDAEIDNLNKDQQILRGLASSGIVLASFSHDLSALSNVLSSRTDKLKELISPKIKEVEYKDVEDRKNPFALIERIKLYWFTKKWNNWLIN